MKDCSYPMRLSCCYCTQFDHVTEDCPIFLAKICENGAQPPQLTQNLQMMRVEPCEEGPKVNIMLRSGTMTEEDKGKQPAESKRVHKTIEKENGFDLEHIKETFMEAKKSFANASTSGSQEKLVQKMDPSMITTLLETCMKMLRDGKAMKGLQELINQCTSKDGAIGEPIIVRKLGKHKERTGCEMRLTAQIGEYEMDQVILDLGSNANVFPKKTWERMGRPVLQWSPIQLRMANQHKIILMWRLQGVTVDIEGKSALADFEVIKIVDDINP